MDSENTAGSNTRNSIEKAIEARLHSINSGNYRKNNALILSQFARFLKQERNTTQITEIEVVDCRRYAQWLKKRAENSEHDLTAASCHDNGPYFTCVRAFLSWCVDDERIDTNPARPNRVKEELPEHHKDHDRQFWSKNKRKEAIRFTRGKAVDSIENGSDREQEKWFRNLAMISMLGLTGARGAELFNDPDDEHRNGISWCDINFEDDLAYVFGKTREIQAIPLADGVLKVLEWHKNEQDPDSEEWPIFPTGHHPKLATTVREGLKSKGWSSEDIEQEIEGSTSIELLHKHNITPPAISKNGARSVMKRICEEANITIDGEYLKPHGGRRGLGDEIYDSNAEFAQEMLRHVSIKTTHESYRDKKKSKQKDTLDEILNK